MTEPEWIDGKATLDRCYFCHQSRAVIKKSQQYRQNLYCAQVTSTESGTEVDWERDTHKFVITKKFWDRELEAEKQWIEGMKNEPYY